MPAPAPATSVPPPGSGSAGTDVNVIDAGVLDTAIDIVGEPPAVVSVAAVESAIRRL